MRASFTQEKDPVDWGALLVVLFFALVWHRLTIPSKEYFDEIHYVPAARKLLEGLRHNPEHPMFGKEMIAASIAWLGDRPLGWRMPSALFGALGLFAFSRLVWFTTGLRAATLAATFLVATDFAWFVQSRIAMLDMIMAGLGMAALWMVAAAIRLPRQARWRLPLAGVLLGLALGAKWSIAPVLVLPGLLFLGWKVKDTGGQFLWARAGGAVPGMSLIEAGLWLGLLPLGIYWATYWPAFHWKTLPVDPWAPIEWHKYMLQLQDSVKREHPYRSVWYEWVGNWRAIWYLYEPIDGPAHRGILLIGNPFTMLAGLAAMLWGLWAGMRHGRRDVLMFIALYAATLGLWIVSSKPIQFYYHYLLPGTFLMAVLALALDALWKQRNRARWLAPLSLLASAGMFVQFYPILSAAELCCGRPSYAHWMWLDSWR